MQEVRIQLFEYVYAYDPSYTNSYNIKVLSYMLSFWNSFYITINWFCKLLFS